MRNLFKTAVAAAALVSSSAFAAGSANIGFVTDYYFRGANLGDAGAYAGLDYETDSGFYAGVWAIDDGTAGNDGLETDFYFGYGFTVGDVDLGIGYTAYEYTYGPQNEHEVNLTAGIEGFSFEFSTGTAEAADGSEDDYDFFALAYEFANALSVTYGSFEFDSDSDARTYLEVGYGTEIGGFDVSWAVGENFGDNPGGDGEGYMLLDFSKGFDL